VDFKKNLFWIALAVIVLVGIGLWAWIVPPLEATTDALRKDCNAEAKNFKDLAENSGRGDSLINAQHVVLAKDFSRRLTQQLDGLRKDLENMKLEVRFDDAPQQSGQFDIWLNDKRQKITKQAADAGMQLPPDADKLMFKEPATDDNSRRVELRRAYRLRQMAIVEEVVGVLSKKYGKQQVLKFQPKKEAAEPQEQVAAGALSLERLSITLPKSLSQPAESAGARGGADDRSAVTVASTTTSEGRARVILEEALKRAGAKVAPAAKTGAAAPSFVDLPYNVTSLDVQFVAPLAVVPAVAKALECSNRWTAVISRLEYERGAQPYPAVAEPKLAKAGAVPGLNTHYQEGPVRALVSLELYEYDPAKAKAAAAPPTPPKKAATKK